MYLYQIIYTCFIVVTSQLYTVQSLGCFECTSINRSQPDCEDTFHNIGDYYKADCLAGRKARAGLFLGTECIKVTAQHPDDNNFTVVVRKCVVDNGGINFETEIGRIDHCGLVSAFEMETDNGNVRMNGCVVSCRTDGCNATWRMTLHNLLIGAVLTMALVSRTIW